MTAGAVLIAVTVSCFDTSADTLASFSCGGAEHLNACVAPEHAPSAYYPQREEYCFVRDDKGKTVKHGHYILWGVRGLRLEEGDYEHGARVGTWTFALPASRRWERYEQGKVVARGTPAQPDSFAIDFCACKDGARSITIPGGHILFQVNAVGLDSCAVRVYDERYARAARYHMSRGMGWQSFATAPAESAFAPLTPWLRARDVIRIEETLDLRDRAGAHEKH